jgi:hypothetical protein
MKIQSTERIAMKKDDKVLEKIDNLENEGMIDMMYVDLRMFRLAKFPYPVSTNLYQWQRWIRF